VNLVDATVLGVVEGLTEFIPVSSTAHLTIAERILGLKVDAKGVTAFTAVIQVGAIVAVLIFFRREILRLLRAFFVGLVRKDARQDPDWRMAWFVIAGSIPIGIVGLAAKNAVEGPFRSLLVVAIGLLVWSPVMVYAERRARQSAESSQTRGEEDMRLSDAIAIGVVQCAALVPGVSRSGATISTGLLRGLDRVSATRISFLMSIPALTAAGLLELPSSLHDGPGGTPTLVGTVVAFVVAYASVAWLLRFVAHHPISWFVPYRLAAAVALFIALAVGVGAT
jgi:undecaprenyl-diphosphatase